MDVRQQMDALIEQLNAYNEAYYQQNTSLISDQAFDQLLAQLQKLESEYHHYQKLRLSYSPISHAFLGKYVQCSRFRGI